MTHPLHINTNDGRSPSYTTEYRIKIITLRSGKQMYRPQRKFLWLFWIDVEQGEYSTYLYEDIKGAKSCIITYEGQKIKKVHFEDYP